MKAIKDAPAAFCFDITVKAGLFLLAGKEGLSMANMLEWLIRKDCEREGLGWPPAVGPAEAPAPARGGEASSKPTRERAPVASTNKN